MKLTKRKLLTKRTRKYVKNGELVRALLETSADLEFLFFSKLLFEKDIKKDLMNNWTLGKYIEWVSKLKLIDKKYVQLLKDFNETRNVIVHSRGIMESIEKYSIKTEYLAKLIVVVCDFIDSTEVAYKDNLEAESEYRKFNEKIRKKYDAFISRVNQGVSV